MLGASARLLVFATGERALGQREGGHRLVAEAAVSDRREPPGAGIVGLLGQRDGQVLQRCAVHLAGRSEEHTSELQSLMRISYAVFCLKKKLEKQQGGEDNTNEP